MSEISSIINEAAIWKALEKGSADGSDPIRVREILEKAKEMKGLGAEDVSALMNLSEPELIGELFALAQWVKEEIYGNRMVVFAPLYISNLCKNECLYCAFRAKNKELYRRVLGHEEIVSETKSLVDSGHKRVLLVAGESYPKEGFQYVLNAIDSVYSVKSGRGEIRRVNVNVAPLTDDEFSQLKDRKIGTYQLFQETYHRETYAKVHTGGKKADYDWRISALDRSMKAGINDVGVGVLFGLADWRFELLALMQHSAWLEEAFGCGPHTISVPRLEPATGSDMASHPPKPVSDIDFKKIVAILRLAVPYTGIILSTRETASMRQASFSLGVSQISAGSRTNPGGYSENNEQDAAQFSLGDHRSLDEVVCDLASLGYVPSFCTGCYRMGRTGADFMDLAKPGAIKLHCQPNAVATFAEYLEDYASPKTKEVGNRLIEKMNAGLSGTLKSRCETMVSRVRQGERDVYV